MRIFFLSSLLLAAGLLAGLAPVMTTPAQAAMSRERARAACKAQIDTQQNYRQAYRGGATLRERVAACMRAKMRK
jgi:hypothetical protein